MRFIVALAALLLTPAACTSAQTVIQNVGATSEARIDPDLPAYTAVEGISGTLRSVGSDTMNNLMTYWSQRFMGLYPGTSVEVTGKGSSTAPPALTEGQAQFGPMSRRMKPSEVDAFEAQYGYKPTLLRVGIDCLAVFVHKDCPIDEIALEDVERAFSVSGSELTWGDLGVTDPTYRFQTIALYGRNSVSGTYGYFKEIALGGADFKPNVKEQPGSSAVVQAVGTDRFAMGYSGLGFMTQEVKALRISVDGDEAIEPDPAHAYTGEYPLARYLYVYINRDPKRPLDPIREQFIRLIFSREGQEEVIKDGYVPISAADAREQLTDLGLHAGF